MHSSFAVGKELYDAYAAGENPTVSMTIDAEIEDRFFPQVLAETPGGNPDKVVVAGAHLDSVLAGPGINGSMGKVKTNRALRWIGAGALWAVSGYLALSILLRAVVIVGAVATHGADQVDWTKVGYSLVAMAIFGGIARERRPSLGGCGPWRHRTQGGLVREPGIETTAAA